MGTEKWNNGLKQVNLALQKRIFTNQIVLQVCMSQWVFRKKKETIAFLAR